MVLGRSIQRRHERSAGCILLPLEHVAGNQVVIVLAEVVSAGVGGVVGPVKRGEAISTKAGERQVRILAGETVDVAVELVDSVDETGNRFDVLLGIDIQIDGCNFLAAGKANEEKESEDRSEKANHGHRHGSTIIAGWDEKLNFPPPLDVIAT